ncbi:MAG: aspartyl/glutamyl-tRNA(Asn/Gln) amidotransferase subunit aspartyl-tRNA(Asn)/glutamyl-tRNA (Gln) [Candidatus Berkelbacteria bacterium]|nr:aspartyl/glutamyl-tRNA(Asn/Gln) amidotransferase subunit aspartyl-tRNA(Asn)/glutamyl-tRNA (Gln) [Candidatus Berkelbacteria bacterium]
MNLKTVIGLEIHVQLKTKSKMFCRCDNNAENAAPNSLVCSICMGMPGTLPVANKTAIEWTLKTGLALNSEIAEFSRFDRKHYFYPDLPKGYQISQYDKPFCTGGFLEIDSEGTLKKIGIRRVHLEEDAGKLVHPVGKNFTLVDLNRAGTPLMEIVTEPEIASPSEAKIFIQELRSILRYLDISDADMEKGHLRCDANISIEVDKKEGIPVEIKNMNSFRMVERALLFEEKRQKDLLEKPLNYARGEGEKIIKETRGWDDAKGNTYSQRSKEFAQDYRYFPEPDLPPFAPHKAFNIEQLKQQLPELPAAKRLRYIKIGLPVQDAAIIAIDKSMAQYFEKVVQKVTPRLAANWIINELKSNGILSIAPDNLILLLEKIDKGEISGKISKEILGVMLDTGKKPEEIIVEKGIKQIGSEDELGQIIENIISKNDKSVIDYRAGKKEALGFLVGQVMRETKGQANPQIVNKLLIDKLAKD